jgi:hypothetical protein
MANAFHVHGGATNLLVLNPLFFWADLRKSIPRTARAARRLLGIAATGVMSESIFSHTGRISSPLRGRMTRQHLRVLTLLNQWRAGEGTNVCTMPNIPLLFSMLSDAEKDAFMAGMTVAEMTPNAETLALVTRHALEELSDAVKVAVEEKAVLRLFGSGASEDEPEDGGVADSLISAIAELADCGGDDDEDNDGDE